MNENIVEKIKSHVKDHNIDAKMQENDEFEIKELIKSIKNNLVISEKLTPPKYRRGGVIGKLANFVLEKFFRVTRKIVFGSLGTQDTINYAVIEALERLDKKISQTNDKK